MAVPTPEQFDAFMEVTEPLIIAAENYFIEMLRMSQKRNHYPAELTEARREVILEFIKVKEVLAP